MMVNHYVRLLRPSQWLKNLMLLFPPFLGGACGRPGLLIQGTLPVVCFCLASSSTYILNDILDAENDRNHPLKRFRPIASGVVSKNAAIGIALLLLVASLILATFISTLFFMILVAYVCISSAYSLKLKQVALVDIFCISAGFILRLEAGGEAFGIIISEWLFLSVFLLSIFLSTGKRLCEKQVLGEAAGSHRRILLTYPDGFLDGTMYLTGAVVLVTYTMYSLSRHSLIYTVPLCTFGLLRYIFRVKSGMGGDPTESLLKDVPLFVTGALWVVIIGWSIYG